MMHPFRPFLLLVFFLLAGFITTAQNITGSVTDTTDKKQVSNVVIAILKPVDSTLIKFTRTDKEGKFALKNVPEGKYILMMTHPAYADLLDDITLTDKGLELNNLAILPKIKLMQDLIIKSGGSMRIHGDTTIFTADSFKVSANANVEELLKKLPGIQVDKDGKIKAMGETVDKVLVDGEEFFGDDPGMAVKNLRADAVKEVQVFDKKSDQAEFTGIDDGKTKKTINLKLKDDRKKGYFGKIDLSGGLNKDYGDRYNNNIIYGSFKGKRKFAGYYLNGNTGQDGLSWQDNEKVGGGDDNFSASADEDGNINYNWQGNQDDEPYVDTQNGFFKNNIAGIQYNNKWNNDKQIVSIAPKYSYQDYINTKKAFTQTQLADSFFNVNGTENMHVKKETFKLKAVYEIKIDSSNSLKFTGKVNDYKTDNQSYKTSINTNQFGKINNTAQSDIKSNSDKLAVNGNLLFKHKFKKLRRTFSLSADWNLLNTNSESFLKSDNEIYTDTVISFSQKFDQQKMSDRSSRQFLAKAVYTEPLNKKYSLELDYEASIGKGKNNQTTYSYSPLSGKYDETVDSLTNSFDQLITVNKPGFKINYNYKKLKFNIGSGIGFTRFDLTDQTFGKDYKRSYTNFFPSATLRYSYKSGRDLRISYNGNTTQPRIDQLQLLRDNSDYFNQYLGNPLLKPSFSNNLEIFRMSNNFIKDLYVYQGIYFSQTSNAITDSRTINASTGKTISRPVNTDGNFNLNFYSGGGFKIKKLDMRVNFNPNLGYNHSTEIINGVDNVSKRLNAGLGLYLSKSKDKAYEISVNNSFNYNSNNTQQYNSKINYYTNETGLFATFYLKKVWSLQNDFNYFIRQKTPQFPNNLNNQLWNAKLQRTFKKDEYTLYFSVRDILNQNTGIERNFYSNTLSEVRQDRLKRYWMLGFAWNFKNKTAAPSPAPAPTK
jgi:hypothetical protein